MNRKLWALAFSLCIVTMPTYAASWVLVDRSAGGVTYFIDESSLQKDGDSVTFWVRSNYKERVMGDLSVKSQETINCRRREIIARYAMFYDDTDNRGRVTGSGVPKSTWTPIAPETINWTKMLFVCLK